MLTALHQRHDQVAVRKGHTIDEMGERIHLLCMPVWFLISWRLLPTAILVARIPKI